MSGGEIISSVGCPLDIRLIKALKGSTLFHVHWFQICIWQLSVACAVLVLYLSCCSTYFTL